MAEEDRIARRQAGVLRRLKKEAQKFNDDPPEGCHGNPIDGDLYRWEATIFGPPDTPYDEGIFRLDIQIPEEYPFKEPSVKFVTKLYHPNVTSEGCIEIDILQHNNWSPAYTIARIVTTIRQLLIEPNFEASIMAQEGRTKFESTAKEWTLKYAMKY